MTYLSRPATLHVHADHRAGRHRTDSDDFVHWWLPSLGPSSTLLAHPGRQRRRHRATTWRPRGLAALLGSAPCSRCCGAASTASPTGACSRSSPPTPSPSGSPCRRCRPASSPPPHADPLVLRAGGPGMTPTTTPTNGVVALRTIGAVLVSSPSSPPPAPTPGQRRSGPPPATRPVGAARSGTTTRPAAGGSSHPAAPTHRHRARRRHPTSPASGRTLTAWYGVAPRRPPVARLHAPFSNPATAQHHANQLTDHHRHAVVERYGGPARRHNHEQRSHHPPGPQRAAVLFPPPIGQTPVDVRLPHRLRRSGSKRRDHLEVGRVARGTGGRRVRQLWEWDGVMDDDELDDLS